MKNLFKNFDKMGLMAFAAAGLFAISWNLPEGKMAAQWYAVTPDATNPTDESLQVISSTPLTGTPTGICVESSGKVCAVLLDLDGAPTPSTIADAKDEGFDTGTKMHRPNN